MIKKGFILVCCMILIAFSQSLKAQNQISIHQQNISLKNLIQVIQQKTDYTFMYDNSVDLSKNVNIDMDNTIQVILANAFQGTGITYEIDNKQIVLKQQSLSASTNNNQIKISGTITDTNQQPLTGVAVSVKGSNIGTISDLNGHYSITVPTSNDNLVYSFVGYQKVERKVANHPVLNVTMIETDRSLNEVVVVGYSTQKKADLTGAVSSVKMKNLNDMSVSGINSALQGRMAGVTVLQSSGAPGSGTSIRIRGIGTIGNNDPLYIIDGMPADNMNDVNPEDIERIDVLKDASSAAIYGSRAANGVVLIQTKSGKNNSKINVSFNTYHGVSTPNHTIALLNAAQRNQVQLEAYNNAMKYDGYVIKPGDPDPRAPYMLPDEGITRTNWQDEILGNAYQGNYDLSVNGGTDKAKYNVILGHLDQNGILKNSNFSRSTVRVNTEMNITKHLKIAENLMLTHSDQKLVESKGDTFGALSAALKYDPAVSVYESPDKYSGSGPLGLDLNNPVALVNRDDDAITRDRIFGNMYAQYDWRDFTLKTDFGYDWQKWGKKWFVSRVPEAGRASTDNFLEERNTVSTHWINTTTLKYDKKVGRHHIMALGGTSYESFNETLDRQRGSNFISEEKSQRYMSAATEMTFMEGGREQWALESFFARVDYSFAGRYLLAANIRADGSSKFSKQNRWGYFPSVSAGWRISEEPFFAPAKKIVDNLKIRASYGTLGNQNINSNYPTKAIIGNISDNDGYYIVNGSGETPAQGRYETNLPNQNLKWEVTHQIDVGLDVNFINKWSLGVDYYNKKSTGVLVQVPMPSLAGLSTDYWSNAADIQNRGIEVNLGYNTHVGDWDISAYGNASKVDNKVLSLGNGNIFYPTSYASQNITQVAPGYPIAHFFGYKTDGLFRTQQEIDSYVNSKGQKLQPKARPGDIKFLDINHDGKIDADDRTDIGSGFPKFTYSFGADIKYKGFDLSMFWQGVAGNKIFNALKHEGMFAYKNYNNFAGILDRFDPVSNPNGNVPRLTVTDTNGNSNMSDYYVDNGDYLRLKTLTIGYTLPRKLTEKWYIQKLRFYVTMQNLITFTKYKGYDPELGETYLDDQDAGYTALEMGVDRGQFPQPKTFIVGLNLNF